MPSGASNVNGDVVRWRMLAEQMKDETEAARRKLAGDEAVADVPRAAVPDEKPRPDAQWDEAAGRWEVWSEAANGWVSLDDGTVQAPGTRSADPTEGAILWPPLVELD